MKSKKKDCGCGKMSVRKKMEHGGLHIDPTEPTRADSLALYNNALDKIRFYQDNKDYRKYDSSEVDSDWATDFMSRDNRINLINKAQNFPSEITEVHIEAIMSNYEDAGQPLTPEEIQKLRSTLGEMRFGNVPGTNVTSFGDIINYNTDHWFNPLAPPIYLHPDISPQGSEVYYSKTIGDTSEIPYYDPIAVAPADELTHDQLIERVKKYGNSGVPIGYQDPNKPGYGVQSSQSSPTPSRPRIEIDKMPPLDFSIDLPTTLQPIERPEGDRLIDTQDIYRTPLSNRNNVRGDEQSLDQVGERRVYERPDGTRYTSVDMFSPEMIRQLRRLQRERERGTVTL
jgi:hypothetical protein